LHYLLCCCLASHLTIHARRCAMATFHITLIMPCCCAGGGEPPGRESTPWPPLTHTVTLQASLSIGRQSFSLHHTTPHHTCHRFLPNALLWPGLFAGGGQPPVPGCEGAPQGPLSPSTLHQSPLNLTTPRHVPWPFLQETVSRLRQDVKGHPKRWPLLTHTVTHQASPLFGSSHHPPNHTTHLTHSAPSLSV
jgi:hypothetical protein